GAREAFPPAVVLGDQRLRAVRAVPHLSSPRTRRAAVIASQRGEATASGGATRRGGGSTLSPALAPGEGILNLLGQGDQRLRGVEGEGVALAARDLLELCDVAAVGGSVGGAALASLQACEGDLLREPELDDERRHIEVARDRERLVA